MATKRTSPPLQRAKAKVALPAQAQVKAQIKAAATAPASSETQVETEGLPRPLVRAKPNAKPPRAAAGEGTAALDKALDVLDAVGRSASGLSQAELALELAVPRTTMYRLLGTLVARGLLRRDPLRRVYCLGSRCFEYARAAFAMPDLVAAASLELRALRDMSGETVYLAARDGANAICLDRCDGAHHQRSNTQPGERKPLHSTSQGKAMMAALPAPEREALVREMPLAPVSPRTITERRRLHAELRLTEQRGYAIDDEEQVLGVRCCGAAIVDARGQVRGAISIAGPAFRLTTQRVALLGPEVAEAARRVGAQLSAVAPQTAAPGQVRTVPGEWAFAGAFPVWHQGRLVWADTLAPSVHSASAKADVQLAGLEQPIEALLASPGGLLLIRVQGAWWALAQSGALEPARNMVWAQPEVARATAMAFGPAGCVWVCCPQAGQWRLRCLNAEDRGQGPEPSAATALQAASHAQQAARAACLQTDLLFAEPITAMAWDEPASTLYLAASESGSLFALSIEPWAATSARQPAAGLAAANLHPPKLRRLATVPKGSGTPTGLAIDAQGGLWTALCGGWSVARLEPDGRMDRVLPLPVPNPSGLAFEGIAAAGARPSPGAALFVTSTREGLDRAALEAAPLSGRLLVVEHAAQSEIG